MILSVNVYALNLSTAQAGGAIVGAEKTTLTADVSIQFDFDYCGVDFELDLGDNCDAVAVKSSDISASIVTNKIGNVLHIGVYNANLTGNNTIPKSSKIITLTISNASVIAANLKLEAINIWYYDENRNEKTADIQENGQNPSIDITIPGKSTDIINIPVTANNMPSNIPSSPLITATAPTNAFGLQSSPELRIASASATQNTDLRDKLNAAATGSSTPHFTGLDIKMVDTARGDAIIQPAAGTGVTVTIPLPSNFTGDTSRIAVVYIDSYGALKTLGSTVITVDGVKCVKFDVTYFSSPYAIVNNYTPDPVKPPVRDDSGTPGGGGGGFLPGGSNPLFITDQTIENPVSAITINLKDNAWEIKFVSGYPDGTFQPETTITRAEVISMLDRVCDITGYNGEKSEFTDVSDSFWAKTSIDRMSAAGVIKGYPDNTFQPNNPMSRAEFSTVINNILKLTPNAGALFTDIDGHWASASITALNNAGFISGYPDNTFNPNGAIKRSEAVTMLIRVIGTVLDTDIPQYFEDVMPDYWAYPYIMNATNR